jgi:hypothetical protein
MSLTFIEIDFDGADAVEALPLIAEAFAHDLEFHKIVTESGYAQFTGSLTDRAASHAVECLQAHCTENQRVYGNQNGDSL